MSFFNIPLELVLLAAILLGGWFWLDGLSVHEIAISAGRQAAASNGLQLLDESVAVSRLWAARDAYGRLRFQRTYTFEVSDTGADRLSCTLTLLGRKIEHIDIPPHRDRDNVYTLH
ncbi:MAG: DUF3301 domain-containing protein [Methylophilales bacterium]|nr:DUF3301 domain-containing protein [Methylophilales bacterium]